MKSVFTGEYEKLARRLISARKSAGLTQKALAGLLRKPQSFVSKYERRERRLDIIELVMICRILGIDARDIVKEIDENIVSKVNEQKRSDR